MRDTQFSSAASEIARKAGDILLQHFGRVQIEYKGDVDLVTVADRDSEEFIVEQLRTYFPGHDLVAEEGSRRDHGSDYRWYVDPLDGTTNFAHGLPFFAVSLGLEHRGRMVCGVVYNPPLNEMFAADAGLGATLNGRPIHVSQVNHLAESLVATGFPSHKRHTNPNIHFYHMITGRTHGIRRMGSAALDLCYTACGRFEAFWEFNLKPWDTAAGVLIVQESKGRVTDMLGQTFRVDSPEVLASNGAVHEELISVFADVFAGRTEALPSVSTYYELRTAGKA